MATGVLFFSLLILASHHRPPKKKSVPYKSGRTGEGKKCNANANVHRKGFVPEWAKGAAFVGLFEKQNNFTEIVHSCSHSVWFGK